MKIKKRKTNPCKNKRIKRLTPCKPQDYFAQIEQCKLCKKLF